jgi:hypothetical protein
MSHNQARHTVTREVGGKRWRCIKSIELTSQGRPLLATDSAKLQFLRNFPETALVGAQTATQANAQMNSLTRA